MSEHLYTLAELQELPFSEIRGKDVSRVILIKPAEINAAVCNGYA